MRYSLNQVLCYTVSFWLPKRRLEIAGVVCGSKPDCLPGDMIFAVKREFGLGAMLLSECILFGGCAAVCVLSDLFFRGPGMLIHIPGLIVCVMTFGFSEIRFYRVFLSLRRSVDAGPRIFDRL